VVLLKALNLKALPLLPKALLDLELRFLHWLSTRLAVFWLMLPACIYQKKIKTKQQGKRYLPCSLVVVA